MLRRSILWAAGCLMVVAACCAAPVGDSTQPSLSQPAPSTMAPATTIEQSAASTVADTTPTTAAPAAFAPSYYRYGEFGLVRADGAVETQLVESPVQWAVSDFIGGVFYYQSDGQALWLRSGASMPVEFVRGLRVGLVHDRPTLVLFEVRADLCPYEDYYWGEAYVSLDLVSGVRQPLYCDRSGPDGGSSMTAIGGGVALAIGWQNYGPWTSSEMHFWDMEGDDVKFDSNPFPESCAPCELAAYLSPDGSLLAYRHRPDAYWPGERVAGITEEEWWSKSQKIPADVVVVDLGTGNELFRRQVPAWVELAGFDGERVALMDTETLTSLIVDLDTLAEIEVEGEVALIPDVAVDTTGGPFLFVTDAGGPYPPLVWHPVVEERILSFAGLTDPGAAVTAAGNYPAIVDEAGNWSVVLVLNPGPNLATFTSTDAEGNTTTVSQPVTYEPPLVLSGGFGLGPVSFGDEAEEVLSILTTLLGPPTSDDLRSGPFEGLPDGYMADDYFRRLSWAGTGLEVVFSDGPYMRQDGKPHFIAWQLGSPAPGGIATQTGMTIGTTVEDVQAMYGGDFYPGELDVCVATDFYVGADVEGHALTNVILGFLDGPATDPDSAVVGLAAGALPSC